MMTRRMPGLTLDFMVEHGPPWTVLQTSLTIMAPSRAYSASW
jgi:hypothetical protein